MPTACLQGIGHTSTEYNNREDRLPIHSGTRLRCAQERVDVLLYKPLNRAALTNASSKTDLNTFLLLSQKCYFSLSRYVTHAQREQKHATTHTKIITHVHIPHQHQAYDPDHPGWSLLYVQRSHNMCYYWPTQMFHTCLHAAKTEAHVLL